MISGIYKSTSFLFRAGSRKGKTRKAILKKMKRKRTYVSYSRAALTSVADCQNKE